MRPKSIVYFEGLNLASLALGILHSYLGWTEMVQMASPAFVLSVQLFSIGLLAGLTLLVSRRQSRVALWVLVALFAIGLPIVWAQLSSGTFTGVVWITGIQFAMQLAAISLAFTPSARTWLRRVPSST